MITLNQLPPEAQTDIPTDDLSSVNFTAALLEVLMVTAGSTVIRAGGSKGIYLVKLGDKSFSGKDPREAFIKMMFWVIATKPKMTALEYVTLATDAVKEDKEITEAYLDALAEGGLSDFAKQVEKFKSDRGLVVTQALLSIRGSDGKWVADPINLQNHLKEKTGFDDLDIREIVLAISEIRRQEAST